MRGCFFVFSLHAGGCYNCCLCHGAANDIHAAAHSREHKHKHVHSQVKIHEHVPHSQKHSPSLSLSRTHIDTNPPRHHQHPSQQYRWPYSKEQASIDDRDIYISALLREHHRPKQTAPAAQAIAFNVFIMTPVEICCGSGGGFSTKRDRHSERRLRSVRIISGLYMDAWGSIFMGSHRPSLAVCLSSLLVALQQVAVYRCVCVFCVCVNDGPVKAPITRLLIKEQFICLFISPKTFTS